MKMKYKALLAAVVATPMLLTTSCIEETFPTSGVLQEQIDPSAPEYIKALVYGMPGQMNVYGITGNGSHFEFGNPAVMHARDCMTGDQSVLYANGYDWFGGWSQVSISQTSLYVNPAFLWETFATEALAANTVLKTIDPATTDTDLKWYRGLAHAFRAGVYLDWARMFEYLPAMYKAVLRTTNDDGQDVVGLTVPKVTEATTEQDSRMNPRMPHNQAVAFILNDLETALEYLSAGDGYVRTSNNDKALPDQAVIYGLLARTYLWDASYTEQGYPNATEGATAQQLYQKAEQYARMAITASGAVPLTKEQALSTSSGFNDLGSDSWMWGQQLVKEDRVVQSSIVNWTSFVSNEAEYGYASAGAFVMIDASLYHSISDYDFRKLMFVAPSGTPLSGQESFIDPEFAEKYFDAYYSLKFRPGSANTQSSDVGSAVGIPLMRVEEMYFIEAEAAAHRSAQDGLDKLNSFMKTYRYPNYRSYASTPDEILEEIILQKRIELWGEGQTYFDIKRLDLSVIRAYDGSNFSYGLNTFNTEGRPAWMNMVIPQSEINNNEGLRARNNPTPYQANSLIQK